ncbi:superoxide dismutase [Candidatus Uhrbacteria bacterium]|nr:superoxide dismutase [Candidatus Uhrbacteria bacterium]
MFTLPDLPFAKDALTPWTSAQTLEFHHGKHHAGYVSKLNDAVVGTESVDKSLEEVIAASRDRNQKVFNLAAQHFNHSFFWNCLSAGGGEPSAEILKLIVRDFQSLDAFRDQFSATAAAHFGSGWAWLVQDTTGKLLVKDYHDAQTPVGTDLRPILTLDVWEHAYYLDYKNDRASFIKGFWDHVNWEFASQQLHV